MTLGISTRKLFLGLMLAVAGGTLCAAPAQGAEQDRRPVIEIDAKNFVNKTENPRANFKAFSARIAHEFVQTGVYRVLNVEDAAEALKKNEVYQVVSDETKQKVSIPVPVLAVRLSVVRYGFSRSGSTDMVTLTRTSQDLATVEVILTVVDRTTGETLISKNLPPMSARVVNTAGPGQHRGAGNYREQALQEACRLVAHATVREVVSCTPFSIIDIENGEIETDVPRSVAKPGYVFTVYRVGKLRRIPRTGKMKAKETAIGRIVLTSCDEDTSKGRAMGPFTAPVTTNCIVKLTRPEEVQAAAPAPAPVSPGARPF